MLLVMDSCNRRKRTFVAVLCFCNFTFAAGFGRDFARYVLNDNNDCS
jgi:hypothetical protein